MEHSHWMENMQWFLPLPYTCGKLKIQIFLLVAFHPTTLPLRIPLLSAAVSNCIEFVGRGFALRSRGLETWNMYQSDIRICLRVADTFVCFGEDTTRGKCYFLLLILSLIFRINISSTSFLPGFYSTTSYGILFFKMIFSKRRNDFDSISISIYEISLILVISLRVVAILCQNMGYFFFFFFNISFLIFQYIITNFIALR